MPDNLLGDILLVMRIARLGISIILFSLIVSLVAGCQPQFQPGTFIDDMGREVSLENAPQRIVSLAPSNTEILFALGLGNRVVGVTSYCNYPEGAEEKEEIGGFANPDLEKIIALKPDLILASGTLQQSEVTELEQRGQAVFWLYPQSVNDVLESFERVGELTGSLSAARQLREKVEQRIKAVEAKVTDIPEQERVTVFRVMGLDPIGTIGGQSFQTDDYRLAGGRNIFADTDENYFQLDLETLSNLTQI